MELVELCIPEGVREGLAERAAAWCAALDKTAVEVPDSAGFVVNRLLFPYLFDAVRFMERAGLTPAAVDDCMRLGAGHPMGPLKLLDFVGLDVAVAIGESLGDESATSASHRPRAIAEMVGDGQARQEVRRRLLHLLRLSPRSGRSTARRRLRPQRSAVRPRRSVTALAERSQTTSASETCWRRAASATSLQGRRASGRSSQRASSSASSAPLERRPQVAPRSEHRPQHLELLVCEPHSPHDLPLTSLIWTAETVGRRADVAARVRIGAICERCPRRRDGRPGARPSSA